MEEAVESEYDPEVSNEYTDSTDEYSPENIGEEYTGEITDLCAPVAKACGDDYRWKETDVDLPDPSYVGKCKPLEIVVDFDGYFDICLDFGNSSEVDSGCYASWTDGSAYHIPGHPTGSHANCGRNIVKWKYAFDVPTCEANGGIETTKPYRKRTFGTSDEGIMCITIEDEEGTSAYDELSYKILKN